MTARPPTTGARDQARGLDRRMRAVAPALAAAAGVGLVWFVLSVATGLIFHVLPGATFLAAGWVFRQTAIGRRATGAEVAVLFTGAASTTGAGLVAVSQAGGALAAPIEIAAVIVAGALIGLYWLRRPGAGMAGRES